MKSRRAVHGSCGPLPLIAVALSLVIAPPSRADDDAILPLPSWTEEDIHLLTEQPEAIPLGGALWPEGFDPNSLFPPETSPTRTPPVGLFAGDAEGLLSAKDHEGFLLFIPKPRQLTPAKPTPSATPLQQMVDISPDLLAGLAESNGGAGLLDPHGLLAETESEDLRRLLAFHAGEASTFANFLLVDSDEQLPANADLSRIAGGRLTQDHTCLAVYPMAEPWRARIFMTHKITDQVPTEYLRGILAGCVQDALQASDPVEQLQRFATQLSIRLIWMERAHPGVFAEPETPLQAQPTPPGLLAEVPIAAPTTLQSAATGQWRRFQPIALLAGAAMAGILLLLILLRLLLRWRRRRMRNSVWILPEVETTPRLGAPHCGQGGAWIRYG